LGQFREGGADWIKTPSLFDKCKHFYPVGGGSVISMMVVLLTMIISILGKLTKLERGHRDDDDHRRTAFLTSSPRRRPGASLRYSGFRLPPE
jgi:hypothetical protein